MKSINISITTKSILLFFGLLILILLIIEVKDILLLLFASFVISSSLLPLINFLGRKIPKNLAVVIVLTALVFLITVLIVPVIKIISSEGSEFINQFPEYILVIQKTLVKYDINITEIEITPYIDSISSVASKFGENLINYTINLTHNIIVGLIMITSLVMLVFFMLFEKDDLRADFLKFFPGKSKEQASLIISKITKGVGIYVGSKIILMFIVCLMATGGLLVLDVKFALFLGLVAGIFEIIPIFGPIIASIPAIIVALGQNPPLAIGVVVLYTIIFKVVNNVLSPIILGKCLNISPVIILTALLVGAHVLGIAGVILSPAIVVVIYVLVEELYLKKVNAEPLEDNPDNKANNKEMAEVLF
ncbi:MAG: AI-2E family transporter [Cyanobacteriota bacterium]